MAGRCRALIGLLLFCGVSLVSAQVMGEYAFELLPDGTPRFTQVLSWTTDPNVLYYEVTLQTAAGDAVDQWRLQEPRLELHLSPGDYRLHVVLYNLLGKPELALPWRGFTVLRAEIPRVTEVTPKQWFIEDLKSEITLSGENLEPGAVVELRPSTSEAAPLSGKETKRDGTSSVTLEFPEAVVAAGEYALVITNPGGVSCTVANAVSVRYERPVDVLLAGGYSPWVSLYESWFDPADVPAGTFFPWALEGSLSVYFVKKPWGYVGAELSLGGRIMRVAAPESTEAAVDSQLGMVGINGLYKYPFLRVLAATARIGGGVVWSHHGLDFSGANGPEFSSVDPYICAGLSLQYFVTKKFFLEAGAGWMNMFTWSSTIAGSIVPFVSAGMLF